METDGGKGANILSEIRENLWLAVFLLLPFFFSGVGEWLFTTHLSMSVRSSKKQHLNEILMEAEAVKEPEEYFSLIFPKLESQVFSGKNPKMVFISLMKSLKQRFPGMIEGFFFPVT